MRVYHTLILLPLMFVCALMLQHTGTLQLHLHHHCSKWLGTLHAYMVVCKGTPLIMIRGKVREALNFSPQSVHHHRCNILPLKNVCGTMCPTTKHSTTKMRYKRTKKKKSKNHYLNWKCCCTFLKEKAVVVHPPILKWPSLNIQGREK